MKFEGGIENCDLFEFIWFWLTSWKVSGERLGKIRTGGDGVMGVESTSIWVLSDGLAEAGVGDVTFGIVFLFETTPLSLYIQPGKS